MKQGEENYVIDWSGAYSGNYVSDVAHTYLLMTLVPKVPGQSWAQHKVLNLLGGIVAKKYLNELQRLKKFDDAEFSKWTVVMSFLRVYYGRPSEKQDRIRYIKKCYEMHKRNIDAVTWYKTL